MPIISAAKIENKVLNSHFSLKFNFGQNRTVINMELFTPFFDTQNLPLTYSILKKRLPRILHSKCFNENNLPFSKEVRRTELGHLFEHILLEYICELKRLNGELNPIHNGLTSWNWEKKSIGTFKITLDAGRKDEVIFRQALQKSVVLMAEIFTKSPIDISLNKNGLATESYKDISQINSHK